MAHPNVEKPKPSGGSTNQHKGKAPAGYLGEKAISWPGIPGKDSNIPWPGIPGKGNSAKNGNGGSQFQMHRK
jgi:hypothetical protein